MRVRAALATSAGVGVLGCTFVACGQVHADPITTPFSATPPGSDAGLTSTPIPPVACPEEPHENSPCSRAGVSCEYGASPDEKCNPHFLCVRDRYYGDYWTEEPPSGCSGECPDANAIVDGADCEVGGDAGNVDEAELHCRAGRATCICTTGRDGAHAHPRKWVCVTPPADCPGTRPRLGQPCVGEHSCDYGTCVSKRGSHMFCDQEVWQETGLTCE